MNTPTDWRTFEELVVDLHRTGSVEVQRDVKLVGKSGAERQIDVLLIHKEGLYEHRIVIECKYWKQRVKRLHVDAMAYALHDLNASRAVFFTTKGYQKGAEIVAHHESIYLFKVRDLDDAEWGAPGRNVDFFIHYYSKAIGSKRLSISGPDIPSQILNGIRLGDNRTSTRIEHKLASLTQDTLEGLIEETSSRVLSNFATQNSSLFNSGEQRAFYLSVDQQILFKEPATIYHETGKSLLTRIDYELGIKVDQKHIVVDRGDAFLHAVMVENIVTKAMYVSSHHKDSAVSKMVEVSNTGRKADFPDALVNGTIMKIVLNGWFDCKEMEGLAPVQRDMPFKLGGA